MEPNEILEKALNYSEYVKGAEYSASDITSEPLMVRMRKLYPKLNDIKTEDKIKAFVGTGVHKLMESFIEAENAFGDTGIRTEVKLKYKNLSGTADVIFSDGTIGDYKTGSEATISKKIKNPKDWVTQLSIYSYLNHKQNQTPMRKYGYIFWITVDTAKYGTEKIKLLPLGEVTNLIKEFMVQMKKPIEELEECDGCRWWRHRWCSSRSMCARWQDAKSEDFSKIEEW